MKTLFIRTTLIGLLVLATAFVARAQDSRLQMGSLDHLAAKASQTVDVSIDERLIKIAAKVFSDTDIDEREVKKLLNGLKGVYVKHFERAVRPHGSRSDSHAASWSRMVAHGRCPEQEGRKFRSLPANEC